MTGDIILVSASSLQVPIEICATLAFALSGLIAGARKNLIRLVCLL